MKNNLLVLVWPLAMLASMGAYFYLVGPLGMAYEMALQVHFLVLFVGIFVIEWILPYHKSWNKYDRQGWNDFVYNLTFPITQVIAVFAAIAILGEQAGEADDSMLSMELPFVVEVAIVVLLVDLIWYICHRSFHTAPMLWKFHALHHNSEQLHVLNNARVHPLELFVFFLPIMLLVQFIEVPPDVLNCYFAFQLTVGLMTHSNIAVKSGWLSYLFNTPELHHWHHSRQRFEHDNNYGSVTMIWDHIFGTYYNPKGESASEHIGAKTDIPKGFFAQLASPFRSKDLGENPSQGVSHDA